jgi:Beta-1,3-glucanase/Carbohydrate binding module (family 6)
MVNQVAVALRNTTSSTNVFCYITGHASNNSLCLIQADGHTPYFPPSPATVQSPLGVDCAIRLGPPGSSVNVTVPQLSGARIWFSIDTPLVFHVNPGPGLVEPSVTNPSDPNIGILWGFCEFTLNDFQLFANISFVDFVAIPMAMSLTNASGTTQLVKGIPKGGLDTVCNALVAQQVADGKGWDQLIVKSPAGQTLRALSPNLGIVMNPSLFSGYFEPYVDLVYQSHSADPISIDTQSPAGVVRGTAKGTILDFSSAAFPKPSTKDIFSCSTGPFLTNTDAFRGLTPRIAAALNRSTLHLSTPQPADPALAYKHPITNHYSRILHQVESDGRGYAFPYDDVAPSGGLDQSGSVSDPNPTLLTIMVGGLDKDIITTPATSRITASTFSSQNGVQTEATTDIGGGQDVGWIASGDWISFNNVDFLTGGLTQFTARVASGAADGVTGLVQVCIDSPTAFPVAVFAISSTGGWQSWKTIVANMTPVSGVHTLYLTFFSSQPKDFVNVNWITFS